MNNHTQAHMYINEFKQILGFNENSDQGSNVIELFNDWVVKQICGLTLIDNVKSIIGLNKGYTHTLVYRLNGLYFCFDFELNVYQVKNYFFKNKHCVSVYNSPNDFLSNKSYKESFVNMKKLANNNYNYYSNEGKIKLEYFKTIQEYKNNQKKFTINEILSINNIDSKKIDEYKLFIVISPYVSCDEVIVSDCNEQHYYFDWNLIDKVDQLVKKYLACNLI